MAILFIIQATSLQPRNEIPSIDKGPVFKRKYNRKYGIKRKLNKIRRLSPDEKTPKEKVEAQLSSDLDPLWRLKFRELVLDNMSLFVEHRKDLKPSRLPPLKLTLKPGVFPRKHKPRRMSEKQLAITRETVQDMLEGGQCVPSCSEVGFPTLLVAKKDGKHRMVIDYR